MLPFEDWRANEGGAVILQVADDEIIEEGRIDHRDDEATEPVPPCPVLSMTGPAIDGAVVMACEAGSRTSMAGHWCDPMPREESKWWATEFGSTRRTCLRTVTSWCAGPTVAISSPYSACWSSAMACGRTRGVGSKRTPWTIWTADRSSPWTETPPLPLVRPP